MRSAAALVVLSCGVHGIATVHAQTRPPTSSAPLSIQTPDAVKTRIGELRYRDGFPDPATAKTVYDYLDFSRGVDSYLNGLPGVSLYALRKGFRDVGVKDGDVIMFSRLMDSNSLFLTANIDTVYFWTFIDLSKGPVVVEPPRDVLGVVDDMWFRWVTDIGIPGPDRGQGGKYLLVPPGYNGPMPEGGYFVAHSRTNTVTFLGRAFLENNDPKPAADRIRAELKMYPYGAGGYGSSIGSYLNGKAPLGELAKPASPRFVEGSGLAMNTIPPNDPTFYDMLDALVQEEPATALDPEIAGQFHAIGIRKGHPFKPDDRMRAILSDAVATGNAAGRVLSATARSEEGFRYYDQASQWTNQLFVGGYSFMAPPPNVTKEGVQQFPDDGARKLNARTAMFYVATGITPAMVMRLPNIGSQYIGTFTDARGQALDGSKTYRLTLPPNIPAGKFWSVTLYDNQTRSMLQTPQRFPRAGSQSYPTPAARANADGSTTLYMSPVKPSGVTAGNWIQTTPGKGWWAILRFYNPLPSFFDKSWRPGEIEEATSAASR
ncbi:DUF1254 domain-containing protein [Cupriavidus agavae]|uniref:DUF1254 domain-containing protein n=1 Tax=Cupriavidus agavae TaxID=1001822 RepID=A0A4Q7S895_9BURK|nr:DUF1254 domain-containing protein [Cupriavidus agavae]RZT42127.1 hypothetical protein EV147_1148 [Cupriavidus agavae]